MAKDDDKETPAKPVMPEADPAEKERTDANHAANVEVQRRNLEEAERQREVERKSEPVSDQQAQERGVKK